MINNSIKEKYLEIENLLYTKHSQTKKHEMEYVKNILDKFSNPHKKIGKIIHITGTNGKGSIAYIANSILIQKGFKVGMFTSPHINNLRERIQINGVYITEEEFVNIFDEIYNQSENLSFFEILTIMAFIYFERNKVDWSVIEVGIGGLNDITNVVENTSLCFITSVDMDHMDILGNTKIDIAKQKAGIIKKNSVCVIPPLDSEIFDIIDNKCKSEKAELLNIKPFFKIIGFDKNNGFMYIQNTLTDKIFKTNLIGIKQPQNISMVIHGFKKIGIEIDDDTLSKSLLKININCRFEIINKNKKSFIFDGAHNKEAFNIFIENIVFFKIEKPILIFSLLSNKDIKSIVDIIKNSNVFKKIIITEINNSKKLSPFYIADMLSGSKDIDITVINDIKTAIKQAMKFSDNICVAGSFYLVSDAIEILRKEL